MKHFFPICLLLVFGLAACQQAQFQLDDSGGIETSESGFKSSTDNIELPFFEAVPEYECGDGPRFGVAKILTSRADDSPFSGDDNIMLHIYVSNSSKENSVVSLWLGDLLLTDAEMNGSDCDTLYLFELPVQQEAEEYDITITSDTGEYEHSYSIDASQETWVMVRINGDTIYWESQFEPYLFL